MHRSAPHAFAWLTLALCLAPGSAQAQPPLLPGQFQAHVEDGRTGLHHAPRELARFDAMFAAFVDAPGGLEALPDAALSSLASDLAAANFYYAGARVDAHAAVFAELARRGRASELEIEDVHRSLLAARRWQEASRIAADHPGVKLEAIPAHIEAGDESAPGAHYWRYDPAGDRLTRFPFTAGTGVMLVVVSHPGCQFSQRAIAALENDPALDAALPARRIFVAPSFGSLQLGRIGHWNAAHPSSPHVLVDRPQDWDFVQQWSTPQFLFLVDGKVVASVEGWPEEGQAEALRQAARQAAARR